MSRAVLLSTTTRVSLRDFFLRNMASRGRQTSCQPVRQKVTIKTDQKTGRKTGREKDKSRGSSSGGFWDYYMGQDLKARFIKRHSKADMNTIPYGPYMDENPKARVIKQMNEALEQLSSDSVPIDSNSDLSCVQRDNDSNVKNGSMNDEIAKDINIEPPNDHSNGIMDTLDMEFITNLKAGDEFNGNTKQNAFYEFINIPNDDEVSDINGFMKTSDSVSDDSSRDLSCIKHGYDSNVKNKCHLDKEVVPVPDLDINPSSINHDFHNSVDNANGHSMDDELAMDINIEPPSGYSNGVIDALNMEFINSLRARPELYHDTNAFYEFINVMNDDEISDSDDFVNHNLQQSKHAH